jgi:hypothetical protein
LFFAEQEGGNEISAEDEEEREAKSRGICEDIDLRFGLIEIAG